MGYAGNGNGDGNTAGNGLDCWSRLGQLKVRVNDMGGCFREILRVS